jgi:hypothetical protein
MRRDVYIQNDSGGFSVLAADAVDGIIEDARGDDARWVTEHKAMLIELYGDDSMPVRIVVDEPLTKEEQEQWLARYTWQIDTSDGRMLVMGGFDPDVLGAWKEEDGGEGDGGGIGFVEASPGQWRVDVYAHVGSMNGRAILDEASKERPGAAYRRSHGDRPFPLWLAKMLQFSGDDDPGHEDLWTDVKASIEAGDLAVDTDGGDAIGFLVHFTRATKPIGDPPEEVWIERSANARIPKTFPLGIASGAPDPDLRAFHDDILGIEQPEPELPSGTDYVDIIERWPGDPMKKVDGGSVTIGIHELHLLHWMAGLTSNSTPRFEIWIEPKGAWTAPASTPDFAVKTKSGGITGIGPVPAARGWQTWWTSRAAAQALGAVPDGSTITVASAPDQSAGESRAGLSLYEGKVTGGKVQIVEASPKVTSKTLEDALAFVRGVLSTNRMQVRAGAERTAFDKAVEEYVFEEDSVTWKGDVATLGEPDERMQLMLAPSVFRLRFGDTWPSDPAED